MWEASKVCSYSQEYLSLLSRRGLLKAVKKENKWLTTVPWLTEYLADKKPGEVIASQEQATQALGKKETKISWMQWLLIGTVFVVFAVTAFVFNRMSNKITELEVQNSIANKARADAMAGFDASVLQVKSNTDTKIDPSQ